MALAIKALRNVAADQPSSETCRLQRFAPEVLDNYDFDRISRDSALNNGMPADWLLDEDQRDAMRQQRHSSNRPRKRWRWLNKALPLSAKMGGSEAVQRMMGG